MLSKITFADFVFYEVFVENKKRLGNSCKLSNINREFQTCQKEENDKDWKNKNKF